MTDRRKFIDIHSHIVYGADDGAQSLDEAIELLKLDREEGAYAVFATHHYGIENVGAPDAALVMQKFELLKERAAVEVPEVKLYLGTEWYCAWTLARRIRCREAFRMNDTELRKIRGHQISMIFQDPMTALNPVKRVNEQIAEGYSSIITAPKRKQKSGRKKCWSWWVSIKADTASIPISFPAA